MNLNYFCQAGSSVQGDKRFLRSPEHWLDSILTKICIDYVEVDIREKILS